jgi:tRNA-2-methylthio-N6-dimethylallyladenosine synthase
MVGREVSVLVEGLGKAALRDPGVLPQLTGRSMADHIVVFDAPERLIGAVVRARVTDATSFTLFAEVVEVESSAPAQAAWVAPSSSSSRRLELPVS